MGVCECIQVNNYDNINFYNDIDRDNLHDLEDLLVKKIMMIFKTQFLDVEIH